MSDYDLNALVDQGKEDVLQFVQENLFSAVSRDRGGASIFSMFILAVRNRPAELDILRTRSMIIQENEAFLSEISSSDPHIVYAMARAAGRVSQMKECLRAVDRMMLTADEGDVGAIESLKICLEDLEKMSVRLMRGTEGQFELLPLSAVGLQVFAIPEACDMASLH